MLTEEFNDISSEDEIDRDHDYISSVDDGEMDEFVSALDISDEEVEDCLTSTEQTLATNENPQMNFASKKKTETWTSNPQSD